MHAVVERFEAFLDDPGRPAMLFDADRASVDDRAIRVAALAPETPLWIIGDLHGDLLALEAALALAARPLDDSMGEPGAGPALPPRLVFLGDFFDDGGYPVEVLLRVYELIVDHPQRVCVIAGNHDESLSYDGARFAAAVTPDDFSQHLNEHLADEWLVRVGKLAVRLFANAPRALLPDGAGGSWGFPTTTARPLARRATGTTTLPGRLRGRELARARAGQIPNRTRALPVRLEDSPVSAHSRRARPSVDRMVRGHDHVESSRRVQTIDPPSADDLALHLRSSARQGK